MIGPGAKGGPGAREGGAVPGAKRGRWGKGRGSDPRANGGWWVESERMVAGGQMGVGGPGVRATAAGADGGWWVGSDEGGVSPDARG